MLNMRGGFIVKKSFIWKLLLAVGILPFVLPFLLGFYKMSIESWHLVDWLIMYSFVYWPTYIIGFVFIVISVIKLAK